METIKTEEEFKKQLLRCAGYITKVGRTNHVDMDLNINSKPFTISLDIKVHKN